MLSDWSPKWLFDFVNNAQAWKPGKHHNSRRKVGTKPVSIVVNKCGTVLYAEINVMQ